MSRQDRAPLRTRLGVIIQTKRRKARLFQAHVAKQMRRSQPWVARVEAGRAKLTVEDLVALSHCIGFDPARVVRELFPLGDCPDRGAHRLP